LSQDKLPPNDNDAEESVIGSLLLQGDAIEVIANYLKPADFYYEQNQQLYEACLSLYNRKESINQVTLAQELNRTAKLESIGGAARLSYMIANCPTSLDIEHYANIVSRLAVSRKLISAGDRIATIGYEAEPDPGKSLEKAEAILNGLRKSNGKSDLITPRMRADIGYDRYNKLNTMENSPALPTGYSDIDWQLGGGQMPGELTILGGDSGLGKSTLAQDIAVNQSQYGDILFCSGEMTVASLTDKEVAKLSGCTVIDIRAGRYNEELEKRILEACAVIEQRRIFIYPGAPLTVGGIRQAAYTMASKYNLKAIWIDYLQKIELFGGKEEGVYRKLGNISNDMANLAKELQVPVNIITQLGSDIDKRDNKRPTKADIYESKRIEQDADWILLLYRIDKYFTQDDWDVYNRNDQERRRRGLSIGGYTEYPEGIAEVIIEKTRYGTSKRKICKLLWNESVQSYQNLYKGEDVQQGTML